jgi:predicted DNA-binding transcriptional regulator AlpA
MPRHDLLPSSLPRRGLSREQAAAYIGVSAGKFDQMTKDGRMPKPIKVDRRLIWDRRALDHAFDVLGGGAGRQNPTGSWDDYVNGKS